MIRFFLAACGVQTMRHFAVLLMLLTLPRSGMAELEFLTVQEIFDSINFVASHPASPADYRAISPFGPDASETRMPETFSDLTKSVLHCYHSTAVYQVADITQTPWDRQEEYGGDHSALIRIRYIEASFGGPYEMDVGLVSRQDQFRTTVLNDDSPIAWNANCQLEKWMTLKP
jgi:hypothetical protein